MLPGLRISQVVTYAVMTSGNPHRNRRNGDIIRTMILHLHLVRHGQTYFNRYNRLQGWSNSPLTESGVADAVKAGERLKGLTFAAAYCSDTTRAQQTAEKILDINEAAGNPRPALVTDMHFREQFYGYYEGLDMAMAWYAAGAPHGVKTYNQIVEKFGLGASRDFLKEADPFHDAESDEEYWTRVEGAFRLIADTRISRAATMCCRFRMATHCLASVTGSAALTSI